MQIGTGGEKDRLKDGLIYGVTNRRTHDGHAKMAWQQRRGKWRKTWEGGKYTPRDMERKRRRLLYLMLKTILKERTKRERETKKFYKIAEILTRFGLGRNFVFLRP